MKAFQLAADDCPKCGAQLNGEPERGHDGCPYVACDHEACRALVTPRTADEWEQAAIHWQKHRYLHGCSHGR